MPKTQTSSLTTIQALDRAHWMIDSGQKLNQAQNSVRDAVQEKRQVLHD